MIKKTVCNSLYVNCLFRILKNWKYGYQNLFFLLKVGKNYTQFFLLLFMRERIYSKLYVSPEQVEQLESKWCLLHHQPQTWLDSPRYDQIVLPSPEKAIDSSEAIGATRWYVLFNTRIHPPFSSAWPQCVCWIWYQLSFG